MENVECMQTVKRGICVILLGLLERLLAGLVKKLSAWRETLREAAQKRMQKRAGVGTV